MGPGEVGRESRVRHRGKGFVEPKNRGLVWLVGGGMVGRMVSWLVGWGEGGGGGGIVRATQSETKGWLIQN